MRRVRVFNSSRNREVGERIQVADRWWARLRGLLLRMPLAPGEGLLLRPCRCIHTVGMAYAIDVLFLDRRGRVIAIYEALGPGRTSRWHRRAYQALELPAGTAARTGTREGDVLTID